MPKTTTVKPKTLAAKKDSYQYSHAAPIDIPAMKRADRIRAARELEYNKRDVQNIALITGLGVALMYTSLWLIFKSVSG
jgi:hypothetical protein